MDGILTGHIEIVWNFVSVWRKCLFLSVHCVVDHPMSYNPIFTVVKLSRCIGALVKGRLPAAESV